MHAQQLLDEGSPAVLAGDYNVIPADIDVYAPERWVDDALFRPEVRELINRYCDKDGRTHCGYTHPDQHIYTFWKYFRNSFVRDAGLRIDQCVAQPRDREAFELGWRIARCTSSRKSKRSRAGLDRNRIGLGGSITTNRHCLLALFHHLLSSGHLSTCGAPG
jgi:exonuclease III